MTFEYCKQSKLPATEYTWEEELHLIENVKGAVAQFVQTVRQKMGNSLNHIITREERRRLTELLNETEQSLRLEGDAKCCQQLGKLKRLFYPMERRLLERQIAVREFQQTIDFMRQWLQKYATTDQTTEPLPHARLDRLERLVSEYEKWFHRHHQGDVEEPEEYALRTAQLAAHQHALEVAWSAIVDGQNISVTFEEESPVDSFDVTSDTHPSLISQSYKTSIKTDVPTNQDLSITRSTMKEYITEMSKKIQGPLQTFVDGMERVRFLQLLDETDDWLRHHSDSAGWMDYQKRLHNLELIGVLLERRLYDRVEVVKKFKYALEQYRQILALLRSGDLVYDHLKPHQLNQLQTFLDQYDGWLRDQQLRQHGVEHYDNCNEDPQLNTLEIAHRLQSLHDFWNSIVFQSRSTTPALSPLSKHYSEELTIDTTFGKELMH